MTMRQVADGLWFCLDEFSSRENNRIANYLGSVSGAGLDRQLDQDEFHFRQLMEDGTAVKGRLEAACGTPVWGGEGQVTGPAVPAYLQTLTERADLLVRSSIDTLHAGFSSIYVDLYEEGGSFVPHTDRPIYGPYVLGMSFGVGSCEIVFSSADSEYRLTLPPRSVYCFGPPLRNEPWVHEVVGVTGRRFGVTFRTEAP
ncbi:hypothetical protein [Candidatus Microthrix parvicella]|uniref:Fe2OG dioxygenase domain-containing protein n=1 Tax=Candidatus Neomicrothrix parvicella RN1 TaxID=1229780 RepID=R4Z7G7_9ACTN|nr:hypothetical protein [Candidatus Microthrix parvicella]CCM65477.1 hypothetical protein BN381_80007 [Candidatus Microthrix parvicella RN1]